MAEIPIFHRQSIAALQQQHPDIQINLNYQLKPLLTQLYQYRPNPSLSIGDIRYIAEFVGQPPKEEAIALANKLLMLIGNLVTIMQQNQSSRLSWSEGVVRGRVERQSKINLKQYQTEKATLSRLIEECRYGITCKSQLLDFLTRRKQQIFTWNDDSRSIKNIKQILLPQMPQNYQHIQMMTQDNYLLFYQSFLQKLLVYQQAITQYVQGQINFKQFQYTCIQLMRQDITILASNKTSQIIKYTWQYCKSQFMKLQKIRNIVFKIRYSFISSVVRAFYIAFLAKENIEQLEFLLQKVEIEIAQNRQSNKINNNSVNLGRNSVIEPNSGDSVIHIQQAFNNIFNYITDTKETNFGNFYQHKLKKRVSRLFIIEDRLTHFYKIKFNPDYAELQNTVLKMSTSQVKQSSAVEERFKQVKQLSEEMQPLNDNQFRLIFEQIQRVGIFINEVKAERGWYIKLSEMEKQIVYSYLFDKNGQRKFKKDNPMERFSKSRVSNSSKKNKSFSHYEVNKEEVFEQPLVQISKKRESLSASRLQSEQKQLIDRVQIYQDGKAYLQSLKAQFGQQFQDLVNFKAYLLPKLIQKTEAALAETAYSDQPLFLQLTGLLQNLQLISQIIKSQINQKKIDLIFYPKVNSALFTTLKGLMLQNQVKLKSIFRELSQNNIKSNTIQPHLKQFIQNRLKYLYVLLQNIDKLEEIASTIEHLNLTKQNYDITSQMTFNVVLKLLLAQKQIKAYQYAITDRMGNNSNNLSQKALKLLSDFIYPNFINSLSLIFQLPQNISANNILEHLLQLCQKSNKFMEDSNQYLDTVNRMIEDVVNKTSNRNVNQLMQEFSISLRGMKNTSDGLVAESLKYGNVSAEMIKRQAVRLQEFRQIAEQGPMLRVQIIDERSKRFLNSLKILKA